MRNPLLSCGRRGLVAGFLLLALSLPRFAQPVAANGASGYTGPTHGTLLVTDRGLHRLLRLDPATDTVLQDITDPHFAPPAVLGDVQVFATTGDIYVAVDPDGPGAGTQGQVVVLDGYGRFRKVINLPPDDAGAAFYPQTFDVTPHGTVWAPQTNAGKVVGITYEGAILGPFPVPLAPIDVAALPDGSVLVACNGSQLLKLDTTSGMLTTFPRTGWPTGLTISSIDVTDAGDDADWNQPAPHPRYNWYVHVTTEAYHWRLDLEGNRLGQTDSGNGSATDTAQRGGGTYFLTGGRAYWGPERDFIYAWNNTHPFGPFGPDHVLTAGGLLVRPFGLAVGVSPESLLVACRPGWMVDGAIQRVDPAEPYFRSPLQTIPCPNPSAVKVHAPTGRIYALSNVFTDQSRGMVNVYDSLGRQQQVIPLPTPGFYENTGLAVDHDGSIWVPRYIGGGLTSTILHLSLDGRLLQEFPLPLPFWFSKVDVALMPQGRVLVAAAFDPAEMVNPVLELNPADGTTRVFATLDEMPLSVEVTDAGLVRVTTRVFVANPPPVAPHWRGSIRHFDLSGNPTMNPPSVIQLGFDQFFDSAQRGGGDIYVSNFDWGQVLVYSAEGTLGNAIFAGAGSTYRQTGVDLANGALVRPQASPDASATLPGFPVNVAVIANDLDPDGLPLVPIVELPPGNGTVVVLGSSLRYTPNPGFQGTDTFTYRADNGTAQSDPAMVTVRVGNQAPVAFSNAYATDLSTPLTVPAPGVLSNDSDPEGQPLTAQPGAAPQHGTLILRSDGSFDYRPRAGYSGADWFTYFASDGVYRSAETRVDLTVRASPPAGTTGLVRGSGMVAPASQRGYFSVLPWGKFMYLDRTLRGPLLSTEITAVVIRGKTARIYGKARSVGRSTVDVVLDLVDGGPGRTGDRFRLETSAGLVVGPSPLTSGDIEVRGPVGP